MTLGGGCRLLLVALVFSQALALPNHHQGLRNDESESEQDLDVFLRQTRKHARPMFYINCGYRDLCYCYSKITRHHYCCSCDVGACFPATARAATPSGTPKPMHHLRTGDEVLAVDSKGAVITTRILGFLDRRPREAALYLTLHTAAGHNLTLSPNHVLFRTAPPSATPTDRNTSHPASSAVSSVFGAEVNVGDVIFSSSGNQTSLEPTEVTGLEYEVMQGAYVPLTQEGTLLVDGIYVSCYASYRHTLAHDFLAPARTFPSLLHLRPGFLDRTASSAKKAISKTLWELLGQQEGDEEEEEEDWLVEEGEGEAYIVSAVKEIGRLWYSNEQASPYVLQVRPTAAPYNLVQKLWMPIPFPQIPFSFLGVLAKSW